MADVALAAAAAVSVVETEHAALLALADFAFAAIRALRAASEDEGTVGGRMMAPPAAEPPRNPMSPGRLANGRRARRAVAAREGGRYELGLTACVAPDAEIPASPCVSLEDVAAESVVASEGVACILNESWIFLSSSRLIN